MKIVLGRPPFYKDIERAFGPRKLGTVYTYGDTIYSAGLEVSADVMVHEETHCRQQSRFPGGPDAWWARYLIDADFRLDQEKQAYRAQYRSVELTPKLQRRFLKSIAKVLSGPEYGRLLTLSAAEDLIRQP